MEYTKHVNGLRKIIIFLENKFFKLNEGFKKITIFVVHR